MRRNSNDVDKRYPGGRVSVWWGQTFQSSVPGVGSRHRHLRLLRSRRPRHVRRDAGRHRPLLHAGSVVGGQPDAQPRRPVRTGKNPGVQRAGNRDRIRLGRQVRAADRRGLRRLRRRPDESVRQLRPVLRLDEVRARTRHIRRRPLAHVLPFARRSGVAFVDQHQQPARSRPARRRARLHRLAYSSLHRRRARSGHEADEPGQLQRRRGVSGGTIDGPGRQLRPQQPDSHDRRRRPAHRRQRGVYLRQSRRGARGRSVRLHRDHSVQRSADRSGCTTRFRSR